MSMFGYNTLGFGSIAGTADLALDLTLQGGNVNRTNGTYSGVSIGTANTNRMVVIQGALAINNTLAAPTSITLDGTAMTLLRGGGNVFMAYLKVPTGTTTDIVISGGGGTFTQQIITFNTLNTAANQTSIQTQNPVSGGNSPQTLTMTQNPVATDGLFLWGLAYRNGNNTQSLLTSNPSGLTNTLLTSTTVGGLVMAYSECTTTDSRNVQARLVINEPKQSSILYGVFAYFEAN